MRYPVSPLLWVWPPLWPFMIVITVVWSLTHWTTWLLGHLSGVVLMSGAILSAGAPWYFFDGMWMLAAVHLGLYVWYHVAKVRRGYRGRVVYS